MSYELVYTSIHSSINVSTILTKSVSQLTALAFVRGLAAVHANEVIVIKYNSQLNLIKLIYKLSISNITNHYLRTCNNSTFLCPAVYRFAKHVNLYMNIFIRTEYNIRKQQIIINTTNN